MLFRRVFVASFFIASSIFGETNPLDRQAAEQKIQEVWKERLAELRTDRAAEMESKTIEHDGKKLRWAERIFGEAPARGHSLWISMHGGGGAPTRVNDQQWTNQISLYKLDEGIYVAPRGPTDNWNLWHEPHIDPMFDRLIEDYVALRGVDPDRIYLMGYSAGGDGVWQLAPRMADRFAAAAMMAGHPNDASLLGLRNLPFAVFVGEKDSAYNRNKVVAERAEELDKLQEADPEGYVHMSRVYPGLPHWMQRKDAEAIPWMAKYTRNPWPRKIVWRQSSSVTHTRFYWLAIPEDAAKPNQQITADVAGQIIRLTGDVPDHFRLRLSDQLLDLDKPMRVLVNNTEITNTKPARTLEAIRESLAERADPRSAATATLTISSDGKKSAASITSQKAPSDRP